MPLVPYTDMPVQVRLNGGILGFALGAKVEGGYDMHCDGVGLRPLNVGVCMGHAMPDSQASFRVDGLDAMYSAMKPAQDTVPEARICAPFDLPYGQSEFHVVYEDCTMILFGEAIPDA